MSSLENYSLENINIESQKNKNQNGKRILEGRILWGGILILAVTVISLFSLIWHQAFVVSAIGFAAIIGLGITYEFAKIFYQSKFNVIRLSTTLWMSCYSYLSLFLFCLLMISNDRANFLFFLLIVSVVAADLSAFIVGKKIGKKKMFKWISPGKTWAGTIGGYVSSFIAALIVLKFLFSDLAIWQMLVMSTLLPLLAILGDLIESAYKRVMGVKDAGNVFRGHGGFLDRADSFLLPIYAIYLWVFWFNIG